MGSFFVMIFGEGKDLNALQMTCRGTAVFLLALVLIRLSGRRSFGLRTPLDNIISILMGAVLSRAVVGASPFVPVVLTCVVVAFLHRAFGWLVARYPAFSRFVEGNKILLFERGHFIDPHLKRVQVCREDVMQGIRKSALTEDMENIDHVYMERNGEISAIKKQGK
ncbi:DUF421 domain-containing protein [Mucilaginibacter sp. HD30]